MLTALTHARRLLLRFRQGGPHPSFRDLARPRRSLLDLSRPHARPRLQILGGVADPSL